MTPDEVVAQLLHALSTANLMSTLAQVRPHLSLAVVADLKQQVDQAKLRNAQYALQIADLAHAVAAHLASDEATALADWARGNAFFHLCRFSEALACFQHAEAVYQQHQHALNAVILRVNQVGILQEMGRFQTALELDQAIRATCAELGEEAREYLGVLEQNTGLTYQLMGDLDAALAAYDRAQAIFRELGDVVEVARADINRANVLEEQDDFTAAEALLKAARATLQAANHPQEAAHADLNLGILAYRRSQYQQALISFEAASAVFAAIPIPGEVAVVDLYRSFVYRDLNLLDEMISLAANAEQTFETDAAHWQQSLALITQGTGYQRLGMYAEAEALLTRAHHMLREQGAHTRALLLDVDRAAVAFAQGNILMAVQLAASVEQQCDAAQQPALAARLHVLRARCALHAEPPALAVARTRTAEALRIAEAYSLSSVTIAAYHLMGQIMERTHEQAAALEHYQTAILTIEQVRQGLPLDELHTAFMDDKLDIYSDALRLSYALAAPVVVFAIANLQHTAPLVAASSFQQAADPHMREKLRNLREAWHWHQSKLEGLNEIEYAPTALPSFKTEAVLHQRLRSLEHEIAELSRRWQVRAGALPLPAETRTDDSALPMFAMGTSTAFLHAVQAQLGPADALLHYVLLEDQVHAVVITKEELVLTPPLVAVPALHRLLRAWCFHLEQVPLRDEAAAGSLNAAAVRYLSHFWNALLLPLAAHLEGRERLWLVLPPGWHDVPIAACYDGHAFLIERAEVIHLSAPDVLLAEQAPLSAITPAAYSQALVMGHSNDGRLPYAVSEAQQVAALLQPQVATNVYVEQGVTLEQFRAASEQVQLVHLATHAVFRPDNPLFSWMRLADARLTVADLCEMTLPRRPLVVLSACATGRGRERGGGLMSMGRGFLTAGASGLIVSQWPIADESSAHLMLDFYRACCAIPASSPAAALRRAQRQAIALGLHPFYWAAFLVIQG